MARPVNLVLRNEKFNKDVARLLKRLDADLNEKVLPLIGKHLVLELHSRTPVDTGRAEAGWTAAARGLGVSLPSKATKPVAWRQAQGRAEGGFSHNFERKEIMIYNAVPYIIPLEFGYSSQSRQGMMRPALLAIQKEIKKVLKDIPKRIVK